MEGGNPFYPAQQQITNAYYPGATHTNNTNNNFLPAQQNSEYGEILEHESILPNENFAAPAQLYPALQSQQHVVLAPAHFVAVAIPGHTIQKSDKKAFVVFEISLRVGDLQQTILQRYSDLERAHTHVTRALAQSCAHSCHGLPEFPPAPWFTDHTKDTRALSRRKSELVVYLTNLFKETNVLLLPSLAKLYTLDHDIAQAMRAMGERVLAQQMERARIEHERRQWEFAHSQNFQNVPERARAQVYNQGRSMLAYPVLTYDRPLGFHLREKTWGFGDATIRGPDGAPWFRITNLNLSLFHFRDCQFGIHNMRGEPLILLQECWKFMSRKYKIFSRMTVPGENRSHVFKTCSIKRTSFFGAVDYLIRYSLPSAEAQGCCQKRVIRCDGSWGDWNAVFSINGMRAASVSRNFSFISNGDYDVCVEAGNDVVLFLALAVCIDKMHYEATRS